MYAVAGVTGHTGSAAARRLLELGEPVRAIVRKLEQGDPWRAQGADVAVASLDDLPALTRALAGIEAAYLLVPPQYSEDRIIERQAAMADAIAAATKASRVGRVVLLSSQGAEHASGVGPVRTLHHAEARLGAVGVPVTFLRAPWFIENWASVIPVARDTGVLPSFLPADLSMVTASAEDVGRIAADALRRAHTGTRIIEIEGPEAATPRDVAQALSTVLGRSVTLHQAPLDAVIPTLTGAGFSQDAASEFREMYEALAAGRMRPLGPPAERAVGTITLSEALRRLAA